MLVVILEVWHKVSTSLSERIIYPNNFRHDNLCVEAYLIKVLSV